MTRCGVTPLLYGLRRADRPIAPFSGGATLRTPGPQVLLAIDVDTFSVFGFAFVEVLAPAPGGPAAAGPVLDMFLAEVLAGGPKPPRR